MPTPTRQALLLTDDGDGLRSRISSAPSYYGFIVTVTSDVNVAIGRVENDPPSMVVVDLDLADGPLDFLDRLHGADVDDVVLLVGERSMPCRRPSRAGFPPTFTNRRTKTNGASCLLGPAAERKTGPFRWHFWDSVRKFRTR